MISTVNKDWPKISVITPSLNQASFLEDCILSVLEQKYLNLNYIIIDGGSSDGSLAIIEKYAKYLSYWVSEPDRGQSDAINKGLKKATGELVAWLNADDYYLPNALQTVAEAYQENPGASFYFGDGCRVNINGEIKSGYFPNGKVLYSQKALIFGLNYILQPATFIYHQSLEQVGYLDTNLHYGMDTDLWIRLSKLSDPVPVQSRLAATREYANTKTSTGSFRRIEELRLIAEKHSGFPVTPGFLCYFLDTLDKFVQQNEDIYPPAYRLELKRFWAATSNQMALFGARPDGYPKIPEDFNMSATPPEFRFWGKLRRIWDDIFFSKKQA